MGRRLISKDEQIKQLERETREKCMNDFISKSFSIMFPAGVLMVSNPAKIEYALEVFHRAMEEIAEIHINLPIDITDGHYETYTVDDRTVSNICTLLENIESCIKCNNEVRTAIVGVLNGWLISWIAYRMKKANILGVAGNNCKMVVVKENGINKIYIEK